MTAPTIVDRTIIDNGTDQVRRGYESTRSKSRISHCGHKAVSVSITFLASCRCRRTMPFVSRTIQVSGNRKRSEGLATENGNPLRSLERAQSADLQPGANPLTVRYTITSRYRCRYAVRSNRDLVVTHTRRRALSARQLAVWNALRDSG